MNRRLADLSSIMRPRVYELLALLVERGIHGMIVETLRSPEDQRRYLAAGRSATTLSRHLARRLRMEMPPDHPDAEKADAMDWAPYEIYASQGPDKLQWSASAPEWQIFGAIAESLGFVWGGRWQQPHDPGHIELPRGIWAKEII